MNMEEKAHQAQAQATMSAIALNIGRDIARQDWYSWGFDKAYQYAREQAATKCQHCSTQFDETDIKTIAFVAMSFVIGK